MKLNKWIVVLVSACFLLSQNVFAARLGGGKSYGMQRSTSNSNYSQGGSSQQQPYTQSGNQARPGMGAGTAAVLGAAAGTAGGYMLGKSMNNQNASGGRSEVQTGSSIPWGTIGILAILLFLGLMLFRKNRANAGLSGNATIAPNQNNSFNIPTINRTSNPQQVTQGQAIPPSGAPQATANVINQERMPDGVEPVYFLRQVKGMFLHIQSMNNHDNVGEIEKYMTQGLYQEIKSSVSTNNFVADFANLDCQLLDSEVVNGQLVASVKFYGMVSDEPNQPSHPFSEIWNFVKTDLTTSGKWLVAGIQQETLA